jgi:hypothetical protein
MYRIIFILFFLLPFVRCRQQDSSTPGSNAATVDAGGHSIESTASLLSSVNTLSGSDSAATLASLSPAQLQIVYAQRKNENTTQNQQLQINTALVSGFCEQITKLDNSCVPRTSVVYNAYTRNVNCSGQTINEATPEPTIQITIPGQSIGSFILVANSQPAYVSTPFKSGTTTITFSQQAGKEVASPTFGQLSNLYITSVPVDGSNPPLPPLANFANLSITINGTLLLKTSAAKYNDASYATTRYNIPLDPITTLQTSSSCLMTASDVAAFTASITNNMTQQQIAAQLKNTTSNNESPTNLIASILQLEANTATIQQNINLTNTTLLALVNEVQQNQNIGCHYNDTITSVTVTIGGSSPTPPSVGTSNDPPIPPVGTGNPGTMRINLNAVNQAFAGASIFAETGNAFSIPSAPVSIGAMQNIQLIKGGVLYTALKDCSAGALAFIVGESCNWHITENNILVVTSIAIEVNGFTIYQNNNLNLTFRGPLVYGTSAGQLLSWSDSIQVNNPLWTKLMNDTSCNAN